MIDDVQGFVLPSSGVLGYDLYIHLLAYITLRCNDLYTGGPAQTPAVCSGVRWWDSHTFHLTVMCSAVTPGVVGVWWMIALIAGWDKLSQC